MQEELNQELQNLMNQQLVQVGKFKEHVQLVSKATQDEGLKAFLQHLIEEEAERENKIQALIQKAKAIPAASTRQAERIPNPIPAQSEPISVKEDHSQGHYALRDANELTVGSLIGVRQ